MAADSVKVHIKTITGVSAGDAFPHLSRYFGHAMHVLILGARAPACLEWARAFHAAGWYVSAGDSLRWPLTRASRAVDNYFYLPEPRHDPTGWIAALREIVESRRIDVILPICEEVFYLGAGLDSLPCRVMTMPLPLLHELHHKYRFACMTAGWPAPAPETHLLESAESLAGFADASAEWVFKPVYSRFANRTLIRPAPRALAQVRPTSVEPWVAQRFVAGREHCSYSLLVAGRLTAHACYHSRYRLGRGAGIYFEPTNPPAIRAFVERFGETTGYTGQVAFDFVETPDGRCQVIECNPRATSGVHLFDDQPAALIAALLGEPSAEVLLPTPKLRMGGLAMLLFAAPRHLVNRDFWRDFSAAHDIVVRSGDWPPLLSQLPALFEIIGRALGRRRGLLAAATADIEWDGQPIPGSKCG